MGSKPILFFSFCLLLAAEIVVSQPDPDCTYCGKPVLSSNLEARTLLTNVNKKGSAVERWIPPEDAQICVTVVEGESLSITGKVCLYRDNEIHEDKCIDIDVTLSGFAPIEDCYCSSVLSPFVGEFSDPNYKKVQKKCDLKAYNKRPSDASELLFCPACKADMCSDAKNMQSTNGAPDPIYLNWNFYSEINGSLSGSGMDVFREPVLKNAADAPKGLASCTPDITDLIIPQMYCSDPEDPENGYGYGANSHSQKCGVGFWFNCKEDLPFVGEGKHYLDINMAFEKCPSQPPTGFNPPATVPPFTIECVPELVECDVWALPVKPNDNKKASVLTTLNRRGIESRWIPRENEYLCVVFEDDSVHITGEVCLRRGKSVDGDICLDVDVTLSGRKTIDDCYCSSELAPWVDDFKYPSYKKVQKKCAKAYDERESDAENLLLCPACKKDSCRRAKKKQSKKGAPNPIYEDWDFYKDITGNISGSGMNKLLKKVQKCIPDVPLDITSCTPVVDNLFLPQMYCSDYTIPENGYGYGANAIDQECGLSFWFNCQEFLPYLGEISHCLDINLNFRSCPPTCAPTSSPT